AAAAVASAVAGDPPAVGSGDCVGTGVVIVVARPVVDVSCADVAAPAPIGWGVTRSTWVGTAAVCSRAGTATLVGAGAVVGTRVAAKVGVGKTVPSRAHTVARGTPSSGDGWVRARTS